MHAFMEFFGYGFINEFNYNVNHVKKLILLLLINDLNMFFLLKFIFIHVKFTF